MAKQQATKDVDASAARDEHAWENLVAQRDDALARVEAAEKQVQALKDEHAASLTKQADRHQRAEDQFNGHLETLKSRAAKHEEMTGAKVADLERKIADLTAKLKERDELLAAAGGHDVLKKHAERQRLAALKAKHAQMAKEIADLEAPGGDV